MMAKQWQAKAKQLTLALTRRKSVSLCNCRSQGHRWHQVPFFKVRLLMIAFGLCSNVRIILHPYAILLFVLILRSNKIYQFKGYIYFPQIIFLCKTDSMLALCYFYPQNPQTYIQTLTFKEINSTCGAAVKGKYKKEKKQKRLYFDKTLPLTAITLYSLDSFIHEE